MGRAIIKDTIKKDQVAGGFGEIITAQSSCGIVVPLKITSWMQTLNNWLTYCNDGRDNTVQTSLKLEYISLQNKSIIQIYKEL